MTARGRLWAASAPLRGSAIVVIRAYRFVFGGAYAGRCRFYPSCSHYAEDAIGAHGLVRGSVLAAWRILRCNPFGRGGIDEAPRRFALHDAVIRSGSVAA